MDAAEARRIAEENARRRQAEDEAMEQQMAEEKRRRAERDAKFRAAVTLRENQWVAETSREVARQVDEALRRSTKTDTVLSITSDRESAERKWLRVTQIEANRLRGLGFNVEVKIERWSKSSGGYPSPSGMNTGSQTRMIDVCLHISY